VKTGEDNADYNDKQELISRALKPENHASLGLKFLLENLAEVFETSDVIKELFSAIIHIVTYEEPST